MGVALLHLGVKDFSGYGFDIVKTVFFNFNFLALFRRLTQVDQSAAF